MSQNRFSRQRSCMSLGKPEVVMSPWKTQPPFFVSDSTGQDAVASVDAMARWLLFPQEIRPGEEKILYKNAEWDYRQHTTLNTVLPYLIRNHQVIKRKIDTLAIETKGSSQYKESLTRYGNFYFKDKVVRSSYLYNGILYGKTVSWYWDVTHSPRWNIKMVSCHYRLLRR